MSTVFVERDPNTGEIVGVYKLRQPHAAEPLSHDHPDILAMRAQATAAGSPLQRLRIKVESDPFVRVLLEYLARERGITRTQLGKELAALLVLSLALLVPMHATAADESAFGPCGGTAAATAPDDSSFLTIGVGGESCFYFNADNNSAIFRITAPTALICLDPNIASDGADNAEVMIRKCLPGVETYSANTCWATLDAPLDGTPGAPGTQNACARRGRGRYIIVNTTSSATQEAQVSIEGE